MRKDITEFLKKATYNKNTPSTTLENLESGDYVYYSYIFIYKNEDDEYEMPHTSFFQIQIDPTLNLPTDYYSKAIWDDNIHIVTVASEQHLQKVLMDAKKRAYSHWDLKFFKAKDITVINEEYIKESYYICDKCGYKVKLMKSSTDIANWPVFHEYEQKIWLQPDATHLCHKCLDRGIGVRPIIFTLISNTEERRNQLYTILKNSNWEVNMIGDNTINILKVDYTKVSYTKGMLHQLSNLLNIKITLSKEYNIDTKANYSTIFLYTIQDS